MSDLIGRTLDRYEILSVLGAGGMGWVYRARDHSLGRDVAIKVLPEASGDTGPRVERFNREIRAVARLSHPNIVEIHDYGHQDGVSYAVMELLRGRNLHEYMRGRALAVDRALDVATAVANGLGAAHREGILHRDIKPANIFITNAGDVKILDFGLARALEPDGDQASTHDELTLTTPGMILGTIGYMSPEQIRGQPLDERSDIFALGCVIFEMLSGRGPFHRETRADTMSAILNEPTPLLTELRPELAPALDVVVARCLNKDPNDRFESARDVAFALQAVSTGRHPSSSAITARPRPTRAWMWVGGLVATAIVAGAVAGWLARRPRDGPFVQVSNSRKVTSSPGWEDDPAMSPDGTMVAYASNEAGNSDVWIVDVRSSKSLRLTDDPAQDRSPAWFPDGSTIAFVSERGGRTGVWRVPRLGGLAIPVVSNAIDPAISPDGSRIAYATAVANGRTRIAVARVDGSGSPRVLTGDDDGFLDHRYPAWSPDGRRLCFADFRDLWMVELASGRVTRVTRDQTEDRFPAWTPDGRFLFFSSAREGTHAIWRIPADGGTARRVTLGTGPEVQPSLSRDGSRLAYSTLRERLELSLLDRRTGSRRQLDGARYFSLPALAPDASSVVFGVQVGAQYDLWLRPLAGDGSERGARRLTDHPSSTATPTFSPDGHWIAYFGVLDGQRDIWTLSVDGGVPQRFTDDPAADVHPSFSPDGRWLAFASDRGGSHTRVWVAPVADGSLRGPPRQVTNGVGDDLYPTWSPDGRSIAFIRTDGDEADVWTVDERAGSDPRRITHGADARFVKWDALDGGLLVSGRWGGPDMELRSVSEATGASTPFAPPIRFDVAEGAGMFDTSIDGGVLAYYASSFSGDIWVADLGGDSASRP